MALTDITARNINFNRYFTAYTRHHWHEFKLNIIGFAQTWIQDWNIVKSNIVNTSLLKECFKYGYSKQCDNISQLLFLSTATANKVTLSHNYCNILKINCLYLSIILHNVFTISCLLSKFSSHYALCSLSLPINVLFAMCSLSLDFYQMFSSHCAHYLFPSMFSSHCAHNLLLPINVLFNQMEWN